VAADLANEPRLQVRQAHVVGPLAGVDRYVWMRLAGGTMKGSTGWDRKFDEPITLPDGRRLVVLRDAASYITRYRTRPSGRPR
jgi:hypothetical protein